MTAAFWWGLAIFAIIDLVCFMQCPRKFRSAGWNWAIPGSGIYGLIKSKLNRE